MFGEFVWLSFVNVTGLDTPTETSVLTVASAVLEEDVLPKLIWRKRFLEGVRVADVSAVAFDAKLALLCFRLACVRVGVRDPFVISGLAESFSLIFKSKRPEFVRTLSA